MEKKGTNKKTVKKVVSKEKTNIKKDVKSKKVKASKQSENFYSTAAKELKKVRWPLKNEMIKYSIATLVFIVFFALFFLFSDVIIAWIKGLV